MAIKMQVRGSFNGWGNCTECTMTRTPGTNIFSHAIEVTGLTDAQQEYAFYMHLSEASVAALSENFNSESVVDWIGWETSPRDLGNRKFVLGDDDGTGLLSYRRNLIMMLFQDQSFQMALALM